MNGRGEGRLFKKGQSGNPDGRPPQNFFFRRDRYYAATITPKRIKWFWQNRYALGKVGVLGSHPDEGKTWSFSTSWRAPPRAIIGHAERARRQMSAFYDLDDTIIPRFASGADLNRVHIIQMVRQPDGNGRSFSLLTDLALLEQKIIEIGNLIGIDPLSAYLGVGKMDSYRTSDVRGGKGPLANVAQKRSLALIGIMHFNKSVSVTNAMLRFSDSLAFIAASGHAFVVTRAEDDEGIRLFLKAKKRGHLMRPASLGAMNMSQSPPTKRWKRQRRKRAAKTKLAVRTDRWIPSKWSLLAKGKSLSKDKPMTEARKELGVISKKTDLKGGWTMELPSVISPKWRIIEEYHAEPVRSAGRRENNASGVSQTAAALR